MGYLALTEGTINYLIKSENKWSFGQSEHVQHNGNEYIIKKQRMNPPIFHFIVTNNETSDEYGKYKNMTEAILAIVNNFEKPYSYQTIDDYVNML